MKNKLKSRKKLFTLVLILSGALFLQDAYSQNGPDTQLYESKVFTPRNSFTKGCEGPSVDKFGNVYAVNYEKQGTMGKVTPEGVGEVFVTLPDSSVANGSRFDSKGNMLLADYVGHNIFKVDMTTRALSVYAHEPRMTQPNDIAIDSEDRLYASDPNFKGNSGRVWRIDLDGTVTLLDSMKGAANGIDVSPDGKNLFVAETRTIWKYDLSPDGTIHNKRLFITFSDFGTDGMRFDADGNLYIARIGKGVVAKISPEGEVIREIKLIGRAPTNVAFGGPDGKTIYVTLMDQANLESFRVETPGREWKMMHDK